MTDTPTPTVAEQIQFLQSGRLPFGKIAAALAKAQGAMKNPLHDSEANIPMKAGGSYTFTFASLGAVRDAVIGPLAENAIAVVQRVSTDRVNGIVSCVTELLHESGEFLTFPPFEIPISDPDPKEIAAAATYAKRYSLSAAVCVAGEEDTDASLIVSGKGPALSEEQLHDLRKLIKDVAEGDERFEARLVKALKIEKLEDVRAAQLPAVKAMVEAKRKPVA